jgi:hypothetical protein
MKYWQEPLKKQRLGRSASVPLLSVPTPLRQLHTHILLHTYLFLSHHNSGTNKSQIV